MNISVIFATHNGSDTLRAMMDAFCRLTVPQGLEWEMIAIDNHSSDNTYEILSGYCQKLPLAILSEATLGKNRCLNRALAICKGELLIFTDDDIIPCENWLLEYWSAHHNHPDSDIFGGPIGPYWIQQPGKELLSEIPLGSAFGLNIGKHTSGPVDPSAVWGANMAIRRSVFERGFRFNEAIGPAGANYVMGSETDLLNDLYRHGYHAYYNTEISVQHIVHKYQLSRRWLKNRAFRAGRGDLRARQGKENFKPCATLWGFPRWVLRALVECAFKEIKLALLGRQKGRLEVMWEKSFLLGFAYEYKKFGAR